MKMRWMGVMMAVMTASSLLASAEARFEKTLSVGEHADLHVMNGSGNVHLRSGASGQIHIVGVVKSGCGWMSWGDHPSEEQIRAIVQNPPIEQTGNIVTVGEHEHNLHCISIDYEIDAPSNVMLELNTGSGDVTDDGVGEHARLRTGSGNIHASGLTGGFSVGTGSGDVVAAGSGSGDVRASTGSGNIHLSGVDGGLHATAGSGDLNLEGTPKASWYLSTGSGNVEMKPGSAGFNLDAHTGSGNVHVEGNAPMTNVQSTHHSFQAQVRGGGPMIEVHTGSGDVRVH